MKEREVYIELDKLLLELISMTKSLEIKPENDISKLFVVFKHRQLSLLESIQKLCFTENWYEACILLTTMIENYILQVWLIQNNKILDYLEYACIESLPSLKYFPEQRNWTLKFLKEHGLISYLKKDIKHTEGNLLSKENYKNAPWQNIKKMVEELTKNGSFKDLKNMYSNYQLLCGIKHSNAYAILSRMNKNYINDAQLAYQITCILMFCQLIFIDYHYNFKHLKENLKKLYQKYADCISFFKIPNIIG